jgi:hypothetical protein
MKIKFHFIFIFFAFMILGQMRVSVYSRDNRLMMEAVVNL